VLGFHTWRQGDGVTAQRRVREGLAIQSAFNDAVGVALMIETLAWIAASHGDIPRAADLLAAARAAWAAAGTSIAAFGPPLLSHHDAALATVRRAGVTVQDFVAPVAAQTIAQIVGQVLGGVAGPGSRAPAGGPSPLTERELEVAELVAQGLSNRSIAARLVVSPRTVDGHVERILAKLGFTSRTQVAAWVAASGGGTDR